MNTSFPNPLVFFFCVNQVTVFKFSISFLRKKNDRQISQIVGVPYLAQCGAFINSKSQDLQHNKQIPRIKNENRKQLKITNDKSIEFR